jgi:hypothetical protein
MRDTLDIEWGIQGYDGVMRLSVSTAKRVPPHRLVPSRKRSGLVYRFVAFAGTGGSSMGPVIIASLE